MTSDAPATPDARIAGFLSRVASRVWRIATGFARTRAARPFVRFGTVAHTRLYRLTRGRAQARSYPTLLLTVAGRTSGKPRTAPLVFVRDRGDYVICAAYSGADAHPSWWLNLRAAGAATIEDGPTTVTASLTEVIDEADRAWLWDKLVRMYPPFGYYKTRTTRVFPIARLTPTAT
ncbi:deazaflavin-dependent oxidoreductase (nitroreductase family) [Microbacterium sp. AK009]|uniref:nitroreductase/quinone reductase family protein n=1 Tax=Microbacterium sp. AK009 TaxID=2723068 RepID=UPI0015C98F5E|nr:nitroreductase/quinone reductase family protein [Microbacterium sp. AK009]NYF17825.1 deazaflavin-dependent oxidoreductase (nitroreductase family) [Microbacterium sp. AK009]